MVARVLLTSLVFMAAGCHSDSGFAHTERNFYAQMIYGESFEFGNQSSWHYIYPHWYDT